MYDNNLPKIALAKGELAQGIEGYMRGFGRSPELVGRPDQLVQIERGVVYLKMGAKDIPPHQIYQFAITGADLVENHRRTGRNGIRVLSPLGFGRGHIVFYGRGSSSEEVVRRIRGLDRPPRIVVPYHYKELADDYLKREFGEYDGIFPHNSSETYVICDEADAGVDITTYNLRPAGERRLTTLARNGLTVVDIIMPTEAVAIARSEPQYTLEEFERILRE